MFKVIEGFGQIEKNKGGIRTVRLEEIKEPENENIKRLREQWKKLKEEEVKENEFNN